MRHLRGLSSIRSIRWEWRKRNKWVVAYSFDWVNDYIAWDTVIGRTGYDLNVAGNVSVGSDGDGSYFWINWSRDGVAVTWTRAELDWWTTPLFDQTTSFTISAKIKFNTVAANSSSWIVWSNFDAAIYYDQTTNALRFVVRGSSTVAVWALATVSTWTAYTAHLVYNHTVTKFYCYINWVIQNSWGTTWPTTFSTNDRFVWDNAVWAWNVTSCNKYLYHAAIRNVALTQAEIDADIALGNTTKSDSRIVAYYIPENLQYNTQYMSNPKALDQSSWAVAWATAVTANTTVAPDWTTTADQVAVSWTASQWVEQSNLTITGSTIASKTFIIKAFVKVAAWTAAFRLKMTHRGVADYFSSNQTATTVWQEFSFTQTFTSSTSGTWITWGIINNSTATNPTLEVRNVRVFLTNESLRDMSTSMLWYVWPLNQKVLSCRCKPTADATNTAIAQMLINAPYLYLHIRNTTNDAIIRFDDSISSVTAQYSLWNGFRNKVHVLGVYYRTWTAFAVKIYINGIYQTTWTWRAYSANGTNTTVTQLNVGARSTTYYSWYIRDPRIYTFTWSFTDADALAIYNWWEPSSAWITKYLHWRPWETESWLTAVDWSWNLRTWTLNNGVARVISAL